MLVQQVKRICWPVNASPLYTGTEEYAIDILKVQEIRGYEQPTLIANAPPFIKV